MPKIVAGPALSPSGGAAGADLFTSSSVNSRSSRSERMVAFDDVLSGASAARRRAPEAAPPQEAERPAPAETAPKPKAKVNKPKPREDAEAEQPVDAAAAAKGKPASDPIEETEGAADSATGETTAVAEPQNGEADETDAEDNNEGGVDGVPTPEAVLAGQPVVAAPNVVPVDPDAETPVDDAEVVPDETPEHGTSQHSDQQQAAEVNSSLLTATTEQLAQGEAAAASGTPSTVTTAVGELTIDAVAGAGPSASQNAGVSSVATTPGGAGTAPGVNGGNAANATAAQTSTDAGRRATANGPEVVEPLTPDDVAASAAASASSSSPATHAANLDPAANAAPLVDATVPRPQTNGPQAISAPTPTQTLAPEAQFAEDNHPSIVAGIRGQLMPSGGTMQIRLDPPELGPLSVTINIRDGVVDASFEASSDQAAKLLSHSLSTLKASLESQGVSVERLNVQQAPKSPELNNNGGNDQQQNQARDPQQEQAAQREQQRREMLRRMWAKLSGTEDPLDMVA